MITSAIDKNCTFLISNEKSASIQQEEICKDLESSDVNNKIRFGFTLFLPVFYLIRLYRFLILELLKMQLWHYYQENLCLEF